MSQPTSDPPELRPAESEWQGRLSRKVDGYIAEMLGPGLHGDLMRWQMIPRLARTRVKARLEQLTREAPAPQWFTKAESFIRQFLLDPSNDWVDPNPASVSAELAMSKRTYQRKLRNDMNMSHSDLVSRVRDELTRHQ